MGRYRKDTRKPGGSPTKNAPPIKPKKRSAQLDTEIEPSQEEISSSITRSKTLSPPNKQKTDPGTQAYSKQTKSVGYPQRKI